MANIILKNGFGKPIEYTGIETIEVPQADEAIVSEMEFGVFAYDDAFGLYVLDVSTSPMMLELGKSYTVVWDGAEYECVCQDLSALGRSAVGIGDWANFGGTGNGEPFMIATYDGAAIVATPNEGERHTVTIKKKGGTQIFSEGVAKSVTTELNFSDVVEKEIYPEQTLEGFAYSQTFEGYTAVVEPIFDLVLGEKYKVYWDGEWWECETQDAGEIITDALLIGNGSMYGLSGNNEPFAIGMWNDRITFLAVGSEATSHTVAVNKLEAGMKITPSEGELISSVAIPKPDTLIPENVAKDVNIAGIVGTHEGGGSPALENVPITLDFTNGNQTITAPDGYLVKSAILQKPADLLAENIAEGKNIGGIIGTLAASGGSPVLIKRWTPSAKTGNFTVFTAAELETIGFSTNKKCFTYIGLTGDIDPTKLHFLEAFAHNWYVWESSSGIYGSYMAYFANLSYGASSSNITSNCFPYAASQYHSNCLSYRTSDKTIGIYANTFEFYTHEHIVMVGCF